MNTMIPRSDRSVRRLAVLLLLLTASVLPAFGQTDPDIEKTKAKAFDLVKKQDYVQALPLLEKLSIGLPNDSRVFFFLGFSLIGQANVVSDEKEKTALRIRARKAFIRAKEIGIDEPVVDAMIQSLPEDGSAGKPSSASKEAEDHLRSGEAAFSRGKLDDALKSYERALKADPKLYEAALFSGDVYVVQNKFDRAEEFYQRAIAIDPLRETAYRYSATPLMKQKKYELARDRYIKAYIVEPYNKFATGGLTQWAQVTGTDVGHPDLDIPSKVEIDAAGNVKVDLGPEILLGGKETGSFYWTLYGPARTKWRKEGFRRAYPNEATYRHSFAEEVDAIRAVISAAKADKSIKKLDPSLAKLIKLDEDGVLEAYVLLALADDGIATDYPAYMIANKDKLRRYAREHMIAPVSASGGSRSESPPAPEKKSSRRVETSYDGTADKTTVKIPLEPITCVKEGVCLFYSLETSFDGRKAPDKIGRAVFGLVLFTKTLKAEGDQPLSIRVDGKVFDIGPIQFIGEESITGLRALLFGVALNDEEIAAMAGGKQVDMKLGSLQFPLVSANIATIADFYKTAKGTR